MYIFLYVLGPSARFVRALAYRIIYGVILCNCIAESYFRTVLGKYIAECTEGFYYEILLRNYVTELNYGIVLRKHITELYDGIVSRTFSYEEDPADPRGVPGRS